MTLYNHVAAKHAQRVIEIIEGIKMGGTKRDLPEHIQVNRTFNDMYIRLHEDVPCFSITTKQRNIHFHPRHHRVLTTRENARIQSFRDNFIFTGTRTAQHLQVGNAVPPLLAKCLAENLREHL